MSAPATPPDGEESEFDLFPDTKNPDTTTKLLRAAVQCMGDRGYHGTTTREVASLAGLSAAGLYVHFSSKSDLLYELSRVAHTRLLEGMREAQAGVDGPEEALRAMIRHLVAWHVHNHEAARVIQYELRYLPQEQFHEIAALRNRFDDLLRDILRRGVADSVFEISDIHLTAIAIYSLGIDVARWYRDSSSPSASDLGDAFSQLALRMVTKG